MSNGTTKGLGDIHPKFTDPIEHYFDILRQGVVLPRRKWIVSPDWEPCVVRTGDRSADALVAALQQAYECHILPRTWQLLMDFWQKSQCGTYFVKNPNWVEPPVTGSCLAVFNNAPVVLARGVAASTIITVTIPDRFVGILQSFGEGLSAPADSPFVRRSIVINGIAHPCYGDVRFPLGKMDAPTDFKMPIILKHQDVVTVTAELLAGAPDATVDFQARLDGFSFPAHDISQSGTYDQFHTI